MTTGEKAHRITNVTGNFDGSGHLNLSTNSINSLVPQTFYLLKQ